MARARFVLCLVLIAFGCALLISASEPQPAAVVWVGGGVHAPIFLPDRDNARYELSSAVITQPEGTQ